MALLKLAALGALGYAAWKFYKTAQDRSPPAFAAGQEPAATSHKCASQAGPHAMADPPAREWTPRRSGQRRKLPCDDPPSTY